jgi:hypothetical protein
MPIGAKIIADSICTKRLTTFLIRCPRIILAEMNTHKVLNRSAASSRAIPVMTRVNSIGYDPFIPLRMGANKKGMQAEELMESAEAKAALIRWMMAAEDAVTHARELANLGLHKGWANRVCETYAYIDLLVTGTNFENFFNLRVDEPAQDEIFETAGHMLLALERSTPKKLGHGEWHLPFGDRHPAGTVELPIETQLGISSARSGRLSYSRHDGTFTIAGDLDLSNGFLKDGHMGPFEHQAQAIDRNFVNFTGMTFDAFNEFLIEQKAHWDGKDLWWGNLMWFKQFRKTIVGESRDEMDSKALISRFLRIREERGYEPLPVELLAGIEQNSPNN